MLYKPKRTLVNEFKEDWGICLWKLPDGSYIMDNQGNYLVAGPTKMYTASIEHKMISAARSLGITEGQPFWLPGFRKITDSEWEDQMERLLDGKVPDAADVYRQSV